MGRTRSPKSNPVLLYDFTGEAAREFSGVAGILHVVSKLCCT